MSPRNFYILGSNDDSSYTLLDTELNVSWAGITNEVKTFSVTNSNSYTYYVILLIV